MPKCHRQEVFNGNVYTVDCSVCSDVVCLPEGDKLDCGCVVVDVHDPVLPDVKDYGMSFVSRCEKHAVKVDSRKATPGTEYAFTLTMPPDYKPNKPIKEVARLIMTNGMTADKPYEKADKWAIVEEKTEKGVPHIHGIYSTISGRRISNKYWQRYWPLWDEKKKMGYGHQGGYHAKARHGESYAAYMEKEGVVIKCLNNQTTDLISPE